jgi:hypothetical protein
MSDLTRRIVITLLIVGSLVGIFLTGRYAVTGTEATSGNLPESVERVIPVAGGEVPRQSLVGIDVIEGHDGYLVIDGVEIREPRQGLVKDLGTGLIQFQPAPGLAVESLRTGQNCITAFVWDRLEGEAAAVPVSWCFNAY